MSSIDYEEALAAASALQQLSSGYNDINIERKVEAVTENYFSNALKSSITGTGAHGFISTMEFAWGNGSIFKATDFLEWMEPT
jgi:hypothetical protein